MRIGVIASMKTGLEHFIYRELNLFAAAGLQINLFPTKFRQGLYNAAPGWTLHRWNIASLLFSQAWMAVTNVRTYFPALCEAIWARALADFVLACDFSRKLEKIDLIYATFGDHEFFVGYFGKRLSNLPLVVTIHAYELYQNPNPKLFKRALTYCDKIITVTEHNREYLAKYYDVDPRSIEVIRLSVDTRDYAPSRKFVVLIVGFFVERKGHEILFRAIKKLAREDVEVWVVGDSGAENETIDVPNIARVVGVEGQVAFFGKLSGNALKAAYRGCDVFCLPCRTDRYGVSEGFPMALAEAMAFGKPVISTRHVEIPRILDEILVEENDVEQLADAIERVYRSAPLREHLQRTNRRIAERFFSPENAWRTSQVLTAIADRTGRRLTQAQPEFLDRDSQPAERI